MSTLLKDLYSPAFYQAFAAVLENTLPAFERESFMQKTFIPEFEYYELKQRMSHTAGVLAGFLEDDFPAAAESLCRIVDNLEAAGLTEQSLEYMFLPGFIEMHGIDDYDTSMRAFERVTQFTSCEFAVRPFIVRYGQPMLEQMLRWSEHDDNRVRRLASEGSRPRLPWAMALPELKKDPCPILPILENLKNDDCEIVRRSVANSLNDISKDNPDIAIDTACRWFGDNAATDALVKHGCRTLLKQAHPVALALFGFDNRGLSLRDFSLQTPRVQMGDCLEFSFVIRNSGKRTKNLRLEYAIHLLKKNGSLAKKVFKISERQIAAGERLEVVKQHRFRPITTRVYYSGEHRVSIIVNGRESDSVAFGLLVDPVSRTISL